MHDFSQRRELTLHAEVAAAVTSAFGSIEVPTVVVGAFARDLHLHYGVGGSIETDDRRIAWPPAGDVVLDVFGFQESVVSAERVLLPGSVEISMVGLPALALLKIVAWEDRHRRVPGKDAADLSLIMRSYLAVPSNAQRLWSEFIDWTELADFDYERSGARMLGHDLRRLVDEKGLKKISEILRKQIETGELPQEMDRRSPDGARDLLQSLVNGLESEGRANGSQDL